MNETVRWPTSAAWDATSDQSKMVSDYQGQQNGLVDKVNEAFRQTTLNAFAVPLEQAHGWIHGVIGGGYDDQTGGQWGHMWPLEYSSYEPMFMLHHA
jgi:tyrosinase